MKKVKVIALKNLPGKLPIVPTVAFWTFLDYIGTPGWGWGVFWTVAGVWWLLCVITLCIQDQVDMFEKPKDKPDAIR